MYFKTFQFFLSFFFLFFLSFSFFFLSYVLCLFPPSFPPLPSVLNTIIKSAICYLSLIPVISSDLGMSFLVMVFLSILSFPRIILEDYLFFRRYFFFSLPVHFKNPPKRNRLFNRLLWNSSRL